MVEAARDESTFPAREPDKEQDHVAEDLRDTLIQGGFEIVIDS